MDKGTSVVEGLTVRDGAGVISRVMVTDGVNTKSTDVDGLSAEVQPTQNEIAPITRRRVVLTCIILRIALRQQICIKQILMAT